MALASATAQYTAAPLSLATSATAAAARRYQFSAYSTPSVAASRVLSGEIPGVLTKIAIPADALFKAVQLVLQKNVFVAK